MSSNSSKDIPNNNRKKKKKVIISNNDDALLREAVTEYKLASSVKIARYFVSRMREVQELQRSIGEVKPGSTRVFQRLPRYKRRRTMSYNIHLLPRYLRKYAQREYNLPNRIRQRKRRNARRRRIEKNFYQRYAFTTPIQELNFENIDDSSAMHTCSKNQSENLEISKQMEIEEEKTKATKASSSSNQKLENSRKKYFPKDKRLVTHMFHAKRMRMVPRWGFRIALESVQKIHRVSYRYIRQHCTFYDTSYLICLQLNAPTKENIFKVLKSLTIERDEKSLHFFEHKMYTEGSREGEMNIFIPPEYGSFADFALESAVSMGPMKFLWKQTGATNKNHVQSCWCWIHPSTLPESYYIFQHLCKKYNVELVYRNDLVRFELRGPEATSTLKFPKNLSISFQNSNVGSIMIWNAITSSVQYNRAGTLPKNMVIALKAFHPLISLSTIEEISTERKSALENYFKDSIPESVSPSTTLTSNTSPYQRDKIFPILTPPHGIAQAEDLWTYHEFGKSKRKNPNTCDILLIQSPKSIKEFGDGWDFITTVDVGAHYWARIAKTTHVLPISWKERTHLRTEQGLLNFPQDYPDAKSYFTDQLKYQGTAKQQLRKIKLMREGKCLLTKHEQKEDKNIWKSLANCFSTVESPISHYTVKRTTHTMAYLPLSISLVSFQFECVRRGTPASNASVYCVRDDEELNSLLNKPKQLLHKSDAERQHAGYVTTGISSLFLAKGAGIGYCVESIWDNECNRVSKYHSSHSGKKNRASSIPKDSIVLLYEDSHNRLLYPIFAKMIHSH